MTICFNLLCAKGKYKSVPYLPFWQVYFVLWGKDVYMPLQYVLLKAFCIYIPFSHIYLSVFLTALALKIKKATFWNTLVTHKIYQLWPCQKGLIFLASLKDMVHAQSFLYKMASAANKLSQIQLMKQLYQSVKQKLEHLQKRRKERFQHQKFSKITLVKEV